MCNIKNILNSATVMLMLAFLVACAPLDNKTQTTEVATPSLTAYTKQSSVTPFLLAEWAMGKIHDMDWSPDSKMFAVNYWIDGNDSNSFVQVFNADSLESIWIANDSVARDLVFTSDGQFIVESNTNIPLFYWRSIEQGKVVHLGELIDISKMKDIDCHGGGQIMIANVKENTALIADYDALLFAGASDIATIRQLDLETGKCKELLDYHGSFDIFDMNTSGNLLAYGGEGKDDSVVVWNMEKQTEVCRTSKVNFGRFVPGENTLAVVREQKMVFIDALTCQEMRSLNVSPSSTQETYLSFSPDGKWFAIATDSIQIMNISTGEVLAQIPFPENAVPISFNFFWSGIKFSPDGRYLSIAYTQLEGPNDGEVQIWQLYP